VASNLTAWSRISSTDTTIIHRQEPAGKRPEKPVSMTQYGRSRVVGSHRLAAAVRKGNLRFTPRTPTHDQDNTSFVRLQRFSFGNSGPTRKCTKTGI